MSTSYKKVFVIFKNIFVQCKKNICILHKKFIIIQKMFQVVFEKCLTPIRKVQNFFCKKMLKHE